MKISAIITNLNNYQELWFTLENLISELKATGYKYEIIVADNGSEKGELGLVEQMVANITPYYPVRLVVWDRYKSCPGIRTAGMVEAKGELICFMDGHVILKRGYFESVVPLFDDKEVFIVNVPEVYYAQLHYEYTRDSQLNFEQSTSNWSAISPRPYPILAASNACTIVRREIMDLFFPQEELDYVPYTMDEPNFAILAWRFGKKAIMQPNTYFAHRPWGYTPGGDAGYEKWRPLGAYALGGDEMYEKAYNFWKGTERLTLPEKHRDFIERKSKVKFGDLREYLIDNGVQR